MVTKEFTERDASEALELLRAERPAPSAPPVKIEWHRTRAKPGAAAPLAPEGVRPAALERALVRRPRVHAVEEAREVRERVEPVQELRGLDREATGSRRRR